MAQRAVAFTAEEQQQLMFYYEEVKHIIKRKGNTSCINKVRENAWQSIADRLNALIVIYKDDRSTS